MIAYILLFLIMLNLSTFYSIIFNNKIEQTLFLTVFSIISIMFIFGILNVLSIGYYFILCLNGLALIFNIIKLIKNRELFKNILTPGLFLFILTYLFILFISVGRQVSVGDELSHWGTKVKNMYYLNTANVTKETTLWYDYLSGSSLFNYFCIKLSGYYNESMLYIGQNLIVFSMILPITSIFKKRKLINYIIYPLVVLLPTILYSEIYTSLYADALLGLCLGYNVYSYILNKDDDSFNLANIICGLTMLVFIKDSGLLFAVVLFIMFNILRIVKLKKKKLWKFNKWYFLSIIPAVALNYVWKFCLNINNAMDSFNKKEMASNVLSLFKFNFLPYQKETVVNFIKAIGTRPLANTKIELTFLALLVIIIALGFLIVGHSKDKEEEKENKIQVSFAILSIVVFVVGLLSLYLTSFGEYEGTNLASYPRYMRTSIEGIGFAFIAMLIIKFYNDPKAIKKVILSLLLFFTVFYKYEVALDLSLYARYRVAETKQVMEKFSDIEKLNSYLSKDDVLYFIDIADKGNDLCAAHYILTPIQIDNTSWSLGKPYYEGDVWTEDISPEDFRQRLLDTSTYLYIYHDSEEFKEIYGKLFIDEIEEGRLYKVVKTDDTALLKAVDV